ncbi:MAG: hypothetical protein L3J31_02155 [Bacteroidales bacterium]|nr:hypothetical protein [Bacteroidales bacterium]
MKILKTGILPILLFFVLGASAQTRINSPYSRYGLGELYGKNNNTALLAMGGISIGYANPTMVNPANPASYGAFDSATFVFDVGIFADFKSLKTTTLSESGYFASLNYLYFGFPVTKWWRTSLGMMPFSKIGYDVNILVELEGFSNVENSIEGDGGLNQFFWGNAFNIGKNFRAGINTTYLFGESRRRSIINFPDSILILGTKTESIVRGGDFIFDYGLQYDIHFNKTKKLTIGLVYANSIQLSATRAYLATTISGATDGSVEVVKDTIAYQPEETGTILLPDRMGFGFTFKNGESWLIGADFEWQNWERFEGFGVLDTLNNSWRFALGGEFRPKHTSISSLFTRMTYRLGMRYNKSYLSIANNPINEFGISFGLTFPLKKSRTTLDLGIEIGKRGTTKDNLIQENFVNFTFGVSINEYWFHKRKFQ